jgi:RNA polymerase sigma factor (TIGR02999 family)
LVHEAYLRLVGLSRPQWESRTHFFAIAAQLMRQILVDYARRYRAAKRGASVCKLSLEDANMMPRRKDVDIVALDDALVALAKIDPHQSRVVELRFFAGLSLEQVSEVLEIAPATVQRDWTAARAWLYREIARNCSV